MAGPGGILRLNLKYAIICWSSIRYWLSIDRLIIDQWSPIRCWLLINRWLVIDQWLSIVLIIDWSIIGSWSMMDPCLAPCLQSSPSLTHMHTHIFTKNCKCMQIYSNSIMHGNSLIDPGLRAAERCVQDGGGVCLRVTHWHIQTHIHTHKYTYNLISVNDTLSFLRRLCVTQIFYDTIKLSKSETGPIFQI